MKIDLVIPAKENFSDLKKFALTLTKQKNVNKIILVLHTKNSGKINSKKVKIIVQKKPGYGSAIKEGMKHSKSKYACIFNADGSFNIKSLKLMIKKLDKNDFVFASRYLEKGGSEDDTIITLVGNYFFTILGNYLLNIKLSDILYTYVLCDTKKFNKLNLINNDFRLCIEMPFKISFNNFKYASVPSYEFKRKFGKKNVNEIKDGFLILIEVFRCFIKKIFKI